MMFQTITQKDDNGVESTKAVSFLTARKVAQEQLNESIAREAAQLEKDIIALQKYESACLGSGVATKDFKSIMDGASVSAKEYAVQTKGAAGSAEAYAAKQREVQQQLIATNNASAKNNKLISTLKSTAGNIIAFTVISKLISGVISVIENLATSSKRLQDETKSIGEEFSSTKEDINEYKTKIDDLKKTINDSSSSYEESYNARKQLLSIQKEMIDKYGDEAEKINIITESINNQTDALDKLTSKKWQEYVNEFNNDPNRDFKDKVADSIGNFFTGSTKYERMKDEMENASVSFSLPSNTEEYKEFLEKVEEIYGVSTGVNQSIAMDASNGKPAFTISGSLKEVYNTLLGIQSLAQDMGIDGGLDKNLGKKAEELKTAIENYQDFYSDSVYQEKISNNKDYLESFNQINKAYDEYNDKRLSGDEEATKKAEENYAKVVQNAIEGIDDQSVIDYFNSMYPELQEVVGKWQFEVHFKAADSDLNDSSEWDIKNAVKHFQTSDDIKTFEEAKNSIDYSTASDEQKEQLEAYMKLEAAAQEYGLTIDQLADSLENLGLIKSEREEVLEKNFGEKAWKKLSKEEKDVLLNTDKDELEKIVNEQIDKKKDELYSAQEALEKNGLYNLDSSGNEYKTIKNNMKETGNKWLLSDFENANKECKKYVENLNDVYKVYGNINNVDRNIIYWDEENLNKYKDFLDSWDEYYGKAKGTSYNEYLNGYNNGTPVWSTVLGSNGNTKDFNAGNLEFAYTAMLTDEDGNLVPLTVENWEKYMKSIFSRIKKRGLEVNADNILKIDAEGYKIDGKTLKNSIAGVEGQNVNGKPLTSKDVLAISGETYGTEDSAFFGKSMHDIQQDALFYKFVSGEIADANEQVSMSSSDMADVVASKIHEIVEECKNTNNEVTTISFKEAFNAADFSESKEKLLELAKAGQLTEKTFSKVSGTNTFLKQIGMEADEDIEKINNLRGVTSADQLGSLEKEISSIRDAYTEFKEKGATKPETLAGMSDELKSLKGFEDFSEVMGNSASTTAECRQAMNDLATELVSSENYLAKLDNTNKDYYISMLTSLGIQNAEEVVTKQLAENYKILSIQKEWAKYRSDDLSEATFAEVQNFAKERQYSDDVSQALYRLALQKQTVNGTVISFDGDLENLASYVEALDVSATAIRNLKSEYEATGQVNQNVLSAAKYQVKEALNKQKKPTKVSVNPAPVEPTKTSSNSSSKTPSTKTNTEKEESVEYVDFIEKRLNKLTTAADKAKEKIEKLLSFGKKKTQTQKAIEANIKAINAEYKAAKKYNAYADKIAKKENATKKKTTTTTTSSNSAYGSDVVDEAMKYVGVLPYVSGGNSLVTGTDCSGLVQQIYKKFGVNIPRTTFTQWGSASGKKISKSELQPGDLVFFKGDSGSANNPGHVAMYAGNGQIIEEYRTGTKAHKVALSSKSGYVGAKSYSGIRKYVDGTVTKEKTVKVKGVSKKKLEHYKKLVRNGTLGKEGIAMIKNENLKEAISQYETWYEKSKACREETQNLMDTVKELYETLANNPIDKASSKIEKLSTSMDLLDSKKNNVKHLNKDGTLNLSDYTSLNNEIIANYNKQTKEYKTAKTTAEKNYTTSTKKMNKSKKPVNKALNTKKKKKNSGLTNKEIKKLQSYMKSNKLIPQKILNKITSDALYSKCINYNQEVLANRQYKAAKKTAKDNWAQANSENATAKRQAQLDTFNNIKEQYDNQISQIEATKQALSDEVSLIEAKGNIVGAQMYTQQIEQQKAILQKYNEQKAALEGQIANITYGTTEWYQAKEALNEVDSSIRGCTQSIVEMNNAIKESADSMRDFVMNQVETVATEADFLASLMDNREKFNEDTGTITNEGLATMGTYVIGKQVSSKKADEYKEYLNILKQYENFDFSQGVAQFVDNFGNTTTIQSLKQLEDEITNVNSSIRDEIGKTYDYETKIVDMMVEKLKTELSKLQELIDLKKEALSAEQSLHDYQKSIRNSTDNIASLQKQITALKGDTSQESQARIQSLQKQLSDAQDDLQETEYNRYISDQQDMLDKLSKEYEEAINKEMKDVDKLLQDGIDMVQANTNTINSTLNSYAGRYGVDLDKLADITTVNDNLTSIGGQIDSIIANMTSVASSGNPTDNNGSGNDNNTGGNDNTNTNTTPQSTDNNSNNTNFGSVAIEIPMTKTVKEQLAKRGKNAPTSVRDGVTYSDDVLLAKNALVKLGYKKYLSADQKKAFDENSDTYGAPLAKMVAQFKKDHKISSKNGGNSMGQTFYAALSKALPDGFKTGGVAKLVKGEGEDGIAMVRNDETILTPAIGRTFVNEFVPRIDDIVDASKVLSNIPDNASQVNSNNSYGDISYNFTLENCNNASDIINQIKTNRNVQKAMQEVTIGQAMGNSRLGVNKYK